MAETDTAIVSLNAGEISRYALSRIDLAKLRLATEKQLNFLPHVLGPTFFRPGMALQDRTKSDAVAQPIEFVYDSSTKALLVCTPLVMRIMIDGVYLTRVSVSSAVTNGTFAANITNWTDSDEAGATSAWAASFKTYSGLMALLGTGSNYAFRDQQITVSGGDANKEHALRIVIAHGTVRVQIGTASGLGDYRDDTLAEGVYSLAFTPTTDFYIRLGANTISSSYVDSIAVEASGAVEVATPWDTSDLANIFFDQSGDVLFVAGGATVQQRRIERRGLTTTDLRSWGVARYYTDDGPFRPLNTTDVTIIASAVSGSVTLTATRPLFKSGHVGAIFRLTTQGQVGSAALSGAAQSTGSIRIAGIAGPTGNGRAFAVDVSGTFVGTVSLQRSLGVPGSWTTVESYTAPISKAFPDLLDNQIVYYRLSMTAYTSGTADAAVSQLSSVQSAIARITGAAADGLTATADLLSPINTAATTDWEEGEWSSYRGFPTAVALHDGRLFWGGNGTKIWGSVSDAFASFDDTVEGDAGPISRIVATGGRDGFRWLLALQRLIGGTAQQEISMRASAFDEPLTSTAFTARACSTRGAYRVRSIRIDSLGVFVERNSQRIFELSFDFQKGDYSSKELTRLKQEMCAAGVKSVAAQRQPDTRLWFVLNDGTCAVLTYEQEDDVAAWTPVTTNGTVENVAVLPGTDEDEVYFIVLRGSRRYIEKLAKRSEAGIGAISKCMDCHVFSTGPTGSVPFSHVPDATAVVAWANGVPLPGPFVVSGGAVALGDTYSNVTVGLAYTGQIKTAKLAFGAEHGTALEMQKRVSQVGLDMVDVAWKGVRIGRDFTNMTGLPATYRGRVLSATETMASYDARPGSFNGGWDSDSRVCIQVASPYPATIRALVLHQDTNEPITNASPRDGR